LGAAIRSVPTMTGDACGGIWIDSLPARQESVEVIVEAGLGGYVLMALQAAFIANGPGQFCRLDSRMRIKGQSIVRAEQLSLHAPYYPYTGVTIDAPGILWSVG